MLVDIVCCIQIMLIQCIQNNHKIKFKPLYVVDKAQYQLSGINIEVSDLGARLLLIVTLNAVSSHDALCMWPYNSSIGNRNKSSSSSSGALGIAATPRNRRFAVPKPIVVTDFSPKQPNWLWGKVAEA